MTTSFVFIFVYKIRPLSLVDFPFVPVPVLSRCRQWTEIWEFPGPLTVTQDVRHDFINSPKEPSTETSPLFILRLNRARSRTVLWQRFRTVLPVPLGAPRADVVYSFTLCRRQGGTTGSRSLLAIWSLFFKKATKLEIRHSYWQQISRKIIFLPMYDTQKNNEQNKKKDVKIKNYFTRDIEKLWVIPCLPRRIQTWNWTK